CLQAAEAIKIISGLGTIMSKKLMVIDLLTLDKKEFIINQRDSSKRTERITNETNYNSITMVGEINASDLKHRLDNSPETLFLLDVREPSEFEYFNIGGTLIPLNKLPDRLHEIPDNKDIIVICKSGVRSFKAARYISESRKDVNILNLKGGLMAWLSETDVPKF
ncbi:MAG TPA: rhodanese-like domain-containing protein, partial [Bacteroidales bacterium]